MKSTLINMVAVLGCITLIASASVAGVYLITKEPIEQAKNQAVQDALSQVLPPFDQTTTHTEEKNGGILTIHTATLNGQVVGNAVETFSKNGFGGMVKLLVGFDTELNIVNINVLDMAETPGLGTKMLDEENALLKSFVGKNPSKMTLKVKKDGGDIDALTAATISSRAYTEAVALAYEVLSTKEATNAASGASKTMEE